MQFSFRPSKKVITILAICGILFIGLQFVSRPVENPPVTKPIKAPAEVVNILQRACYDCHSNETNLSWYDKVAPASWLINADVKEARSRFNFSTWDTLSAGEQQGRVWEIVNMVLTKKMPLSTYAALHPQARLSQQDIDILKKYANGLSPYSYHDTSIINAAEHEFAVFTQTQASTKPLPVAANGVQYIPDFSNWQVISTTNRFDNHSIRILYGNAIAVEAIRQKKTKPFPNGSTIVKAVWNSIEETNGDITPGSLNSIQIMTKNNELFKDSKGWGFAKFNGMQLKPYGATRVFNTTCFNCHKIADNNDYIFNLPLEDKEGAREMFDAGELKVITSFANSKTQTMSTLYGNTAAMKSALSGYTTHAQGEIFQLVTYAQANNRYWYGSYINGAVISVETISTDNSAGVKLFYKLTQGKTPVDKAGNVINAEARIKDIFTHRPSVFPQQ